MPLDVTSSTMQFSAVDRGPERMSFNVFNGRLGYTIFSGNGASRLMSQSLSADALELLKSNLKEVQGGQAGTTRTLVCQKWLREEKKYVTDSTLIIGKDDKNVYYFEAQFNSVGSSKSIRFDFRASQAVTTSTDQVSPASLSATRMDAFLYWVNMQVPLLQVMTLRPYTGGNNSQGGNASGGGSSTPANDYSGEDASF